MKSILIIMDNSNPQSPQSTIPISQEPTKMKQSVEIQYLDALEYSNTSNIVGTSTLGTSPIDFEQENVYVSKSYDIQAEEYKALFSASLETNNCYKNLNSQNEIISLSPSTGKTPKRDKEAVDELSLILVECMDKINTRSREVLLRKFYAEVEREERLERFIVERLRKSKVKAITELCENITKIDDVPKRGLCENEEEESNKLERFKVRTFDIGGGVLDEKNK